MAKRKFGPNPYPYRDVTDLAADFVKRLAQDARCAAHALAPLLLPVAHRIDGETCRTGGYMCLFEVVLATSSARQDNVVLCIPVGIVPNGKARKYFRIAIKKATDLALRLKEGELLSWQSRNGKTRFAGAAATPRENRQGRRCILSFSGLNGLADEAFVLVLMIYLRLITEKTARRLAAISNNNYFEPMLEAVRRAA
ncbi:MAG: hypothetical protein HY420_04720 [Candidatus Kerfeldbacteria bacterium]|nr:hypothetical protein [Candidatus Kerfeldbacteria bacterium]